jgi:Tol biopolymer transport system component
MRTTTLLAALLAGLSTLPAQPPAKTPLLIAFASFRDRPLHPKVFFYEHDGVSEGKLVGSIDALNQRSDYRPSLSHDGRLCAFSAELENQTGKILLWDCKERKLLDLPTLNDSPNALIGSALSGDGKWLALAAWARPGTGNRWDVQLYDLAAKKFADLPGLNTPNFDERMPSLSGDGRYLLYQTNARGNQGLSDLSLYDRSEKKVDPLEGLNSPHSDTDGALSGDGRLIAFTSDRPGGKGGRDVYLYDRGDKKLLPLPGLNSAAQDMSPGLSPDGRFVVFVSDRIKGVGERDVWLYDRQRGTLLPTPGLNSKQDDFDPVVIRLSP